MLTPEQKKQFNEILDSLGETLDISETQYNVAVKSYESVGNWLAGEGSSLAPYSPEILPQGSFMLGTMIKPISENDDLDIDLVCQLKGKNPSWTQFDLKQKIGDRLKSKELYDEMLDDEGRRCWTLLYRKNSINEGEKYHMDILPSIVDSGYSYILEKAFSSVELSMSSLDELAIRITDNEELNYYYEPEHLKWLKSNPFGYGKWFFDQAKLEIFKAFAVNESVQPVPTYRKEKLPLQRAVQILKRHRDMMFNGDENKPISIIITTLAAKAYRKEVNVLEALRNIVDRLEESIEEFNPHTGEKMKWIGNPVNDQENFADKWIETAQKQINFYSWLDKLRLDIRHIYSQTSQIYLMESMNKAFGEDVIQKAFSNVGDKSRLLTEQGENRFDVKIGLTTSGSHSIKAHKFYGSGLEE